MSTLSIIVLSVLAAIFGLILLAAIAVLIWLLFRQHRLMLRFDAAQLDIQSALAKSLADHTAHLSLLSTQISATLELHRSQVDAQIKLIRGEEISQAVKDFLSVIPRQAQVAVRIEKAVILFTDLVKHIAGEAEISGSALERARESGLGPESYATAAPGEHFISRSRVASSDSEALAEESADNSQSFIDDEG